MGKIFYTEEHDWIEVLEENRVRLGITEYAQEQLGDVVYVELPEEGDDFEEGEEFGAVESVKSVSAILSPVTGVITSVNDILEAEPELVNDDATGAGWLVEIKTEEAVDVTKFLTKNTYDALIEDE
jgi:glycine cleavage system H protein